MRLIALALFAASTLGLADAGWTKATEQLKKRDNALSPGVKDWSTLPASERGKDRAGHAALTSLASEAARTGGLLKLEPSSTWHLDYADDSCRLMRKFGRGGQETVLLLERYQPGDSFFMVAAGPPLKSRSRGEPKFRFGPDGHEYDGPSFNGDLGPYEPAFMASMSLLPLSYERKNQPGRNRSDPGEAAREMFKQELSAEQEANIEWLEVQHGKAPPVRFMLGSMAPPMEAMRKCTDELLTHWGIDIKAHKELTRAVAPSTNPGSWLSFRDYPVDLLRKGEQGIVQFRLSVDGGGRPTQCHIQKSTRPAGFDDAVCRALMERARFEPALGGNGQPIASFWRSRVTFELPPRAR